MTVGVPESFPMVVTGQAEEGDFSATVNYTHKQLNMVVSGSPEDMTYDYAADTLGVVLESIEVEGEAVPDDVFNLAVEANDLTGSSRMQIAENRDLTQTFNAASLTYNMNFQDPESGETGLINGQLELTTDPNVPITSFTQADIDLGHLVYRHDGGDTTNCMQNKCGTTRNEEMW